MAKLPGSDTECYFGFTNALPNWRADLSQPADPAAISAIVGFDTRELDQPAEAAPILVKRARKYSKSAELAPAFELAASLPAYLPAELHADAWKRAHQIAAGAAVENPQDSIILQALSRGALRYARKYGRRKTYEVVNQLTTDSQKISTYTVNKPIRRWRDARGYVHAPKPPKPTCVEQSPGPRGGRIWDCGGTKGGEKPKESSQKPGSDTDSQKPADGPRKPKPADPGRSLGIDQAIELISDARNNPTPDRIEKLAATLATMKKEDLRALKRQQGVRADDDTKAGLAKKIAKAATVRLTQREYWMQQARKDGVRPEDMLLASRDIRAAHNRMADMVNKMVTEARQTYAKLGGKVLTRRNKAFNGGDYNQIRGFDVLAREMAGRYPELLGAHGYEEDDPNSSKSTEAAEKLFAFFAAGKQNRMSFGESQRQAIGLIRGIGEMRNEQRYGDDESMPFSRRGEAVHV